MRQECTVLSAIHRQTHRHNFITKTQAGEDDTLILDSKIVQVILNSLPKSYQTFVGIHRGLPHPPTLEALILAVEIEERTQDSCNVMVDSLVTMELTFFIYIYVIRFLFIFMGGRFWNVVPEGCMLSMHAVCMHR